MKWIDVNEVAVELSEKYRDEDPRYILFTNLHKYIVNLDDFDDEPDKSNEKILEAIQMAWIEELD